MLAQEYGRRPQSFVLKWRLHGQGWRNGNSRSSASCTMPPLVQHPFGGLAQVMQLADTPLNLRDYRELSYTCCLIQSHSRPNRS